MFPVDLFSFIELVFCVLYYPIIMLEWEKTKEINSEEINSEEILEATLDPHYEITDKNKNNAKIIDAELIDEDSFDDEVTVIYKR